jgi:hypothetical protein
MAFLNDIFKEVEEVVLPAGANAAALTKEARRAKNLNIFTGIILKTIKILSQKQIFT